MSHVLCLSLFFRGPVRTLVPACWMAVLLALLAAPTQLAHAHGVIPLDTTGMAAAPAGQPGAAQAPWLVALTAGALVSRDQGKTYSWICEEALVGPAVDDLALGVTGDGLLLAGNNNSGLLLSSDAGCSWQSSGAFVHPNTFSALALDDAQAASWFVTSNATADGHGSVWRTHDSGGTYEQLKFDQAGIYLTHVAAAGKALVVAGTNNHLKNSAHVFVSHDGGTSWQGGAVPGAPGLASDVRVFALGSPQPVQWAAAVLDGRNNASTLLLAPRPTGPWRVAHTLGQPIRQVAASADGQQILVGGMHKTAFSRDGGQTFAEPAVPQGNGCAANVGGNLMVCGSKAFGDGFSLAQITSDAPSLQPAFAFNQTVGPYQCASNTAVHERCLPLWPEVAQRFGASAAAPKDLQVDAPKPVPAQGCACNAGREAGSARAAGSEWHDGLGQVLALWVSWYVLRPQLRRRQAVRVRPAAPPRRRR